MMLSTFPARRHFRWVLLLCLLAPVLAGCAVEQYPQTTLNPLGDFARLVDDVFMTTVWWALLVFVLVETALVYAILRFRGKPNDAEPAQVHGNTTVEIVWTVIPALILAMIAVPTVRAIFKTNETPTGDVLTIEIIGHQWWWEFRYPEYNLTTANELHVPVGRTVALKMATKDVVHSFWVPQFAAKRDVFPNRETRIWFRAEKAGEYPGQCAEFCGIQHGKMAFRVMADEAGAFDEWVQRMRTIGVTAAAPAAAPPAGDTVRTTSQGATLQQERSADSAAAAAPAPAQDAQYAAGQKLFMTKGCAGCHALTALNAPQLIGPNLANVGRRSYIAAGFVKNTDENLARWIMNPQAIKEGVLMPNLGVTEAEAQALVKYLREQR